MYAYFDLLFNWRIKFIFVDSWQLSTWHLLIFLGLQKWLLVSIMDLVDLAIIMWALYKHLLTTFLGNVEGQSENIVQDIENMVRSYIEKVISIGMFSFSIF